MVKVIDNIDLKINSWEFFNYETFALNKNELKIYLNGEEIASWLKVTDNDELYYATGRFFLFVLLEKNLGLKISYWEQEEKGGTEGLEKVIAIQKVLYKEGVSFDCEENVYVIPITDIINSEERRFYCYKTYTDSDVTWFREHSRYRKKVMDRMSPKIYTICDKNNIKRRMGTFGELKKATNYIRTMDGEFKFVDIDHRYYFYKMSDKLIEKILKHGQFPYGKRKYPYQSVNDLNGTRDMAHRLEVLQLPDSFVSKSVLDLGCNLGSFCVLARIRGSKHIVGIDNNKETIDTGKYFLQEGKYGDCHLFKFDINDGLAKFREITNNYKFEYIFALSILKHVNKDCLFDIINYCLKDICWFEGHNKQNKEWLEKELVDNLNPASVTFLGYTTDRGTRPVFRIEKKGGIDMNEEFNEEVVEDEEEVVEEEVVEEEIVEEEVVEEIPSLKYDRKYYEKMAFGSRMAWQARLGKLFVETFNAKSLVDFGCGIGAYMLGALQEIAGNVHGYDRGARIVGGLVPERVLGEIEFADVGTPINFAGKNSWDCAISIDVADYLKPEQTNIFISNLVENTNNVIIFVAGPSRADAYCTNRQDKDFWISKINETGKFEYSEEDTNMLKDTLKGVECMPNIKQDVLVFKKAVVPEPEPEIEEVEEIEENEEYEEEEEE